jgi:hypothetical protein
MEIEYLEKFYKYAISSNITLEFLSSISSHNAIFIQHPLNDRVTSSQHSISMDWANFIRFEGDDLPFYLYQYNFTVEAIYFPTRHLCVFFPHLRDVKDKTKQLIEKIVKNIKHYSIYYSKNNNFAGIKLEHSSPFHYYYFKFHALHRSLLSMQKKYLFTITTTPTIGGFLKIENVFPENIKKNIFNGNWTKINDEVLPLECKNENFFITIGDRWDLITKNEVKDLDELLLESVKLNCKEMKNYKDINKIKENSDIIIWLGITTGKRKWIEEVDSYVKIINYYINQGKNIGVIFDGWTATYKHANVNNANKFYSEDTEIMLQITTKIINLNKFSYISAIGLTAEEKICLGINCDYFIANHSTGSLWISRICKKPGVTHISNSARSHAEKVHIHYNTKLISTELVHDINNEDERYHVSYHIDSDDFLNFVIVNMNT